MMSFTLQCRYYLPDRQFYVWRLKCPACNRVKGIVRSPVRSPKTSLGWRKHYKNKWLCAQCQAAKHLKQASEVTG